MDGARMSEVAAFSTTVDGLYAAAIGEMSWADALAGMCRVLGSPAATLNVHDPVKRVSRLVVGEFGTDPSYSESFNARYSAISPFPLTSMMGAEGSIGRPFAVVGRDSVLSSPFYKEWCLPQRYNDFLGGIMIREARGIYAIGFVRLLDQPLFSEEDERILALLLPHVTRAFRVSGALDTLRAQRNDVFAAIEALPTPIIALDGEGIVVTINTAALRLADAGGPIRIERGRLSFVEAAAQQALSDAFSSGTTKPIHVTIGAQPPLAATLVPYAGSAGRIAAVVAIQHAQKTEAPPGLMLQQAFGFTPAELRILMMLLEGGTRETVAADLGLSLATVKTHIQGLFAKTQTNRQADLVRVVMGG
jgi:DNA-binding CsgD family transcriptional regulator/PAS domain-containing protein